MKYSSSLNTSSNHFLAGIVALGLSLVCASQTWANNIILNGSFSSGNFTDWTTFADASNTWSVDTPGTGGVTSPGSDYATIHCNGGATVDSIYQVVNVPNAAAGTITAAISVLRVTDSGYNGPGQSGGQWNIAVYGLSAGYTLSTAVSGAVPVGTPTSGGTLLSTAVFLNISLNTWTTIPTSGTLTSSPSVVYPAYEVIIYSVKQGSSTTRNGHFTNISLDVPITQNSLATWIAGFPGLSDTTPSGNPSHDGLSNLVKYALGLDPTKSAQPPGTLLGGSLSFTKGSMAKGDSNISYTIQESTDLVTWTTPTGIAPSGTVNNGANSISYTYPTGPTKVFARLKVIQSP